MTYAAMIFFILAVVCALFGFTTFESGAEPAAAAMARLLAIAFGVAFLMAAGALAVRRTSERRGLADVAEGPDLPRLGAGLSASERGSWDGSRRHRRTAIQRTNGRT